MLVIDASAVAELLLVRPGRAALVERHIVEHDGDLHAPHLIDIEVLSALRRVVASGIATAARADDAVSDFQDMTIERYPPEPLVPRAWELRNNFSAYDATYVALAEALADGGVPLLTADRRLAKAMRKHAGARVLLAA